MARSESSLTTYSPDETIRLGVRLGAAAAAGDVIALFGGLGAGKTVLTQGIMRGLGGNPRAVTSPTFTLMVRHEARIPLHHVDAYRLSGSGELTEIGAEEVFDGDGLSVIEWAERAEGVLPNDRLEIHLAVLAENERLFRLEATGPRGRRLLEAARSLV